LENVAVSVLSLEHARARRPLTKPALLSFKYFKRLGWLLLQVLRHWAAADDAHKPTRTARPGPSILEAPTG
jgi:hypothetical protein